MSSSITAEITNEKPITLDDIVNEANNIWNDYKNEKIDINNHKKLDEYLAKVQREHKDIYVAYPMVIRHMIQEKQYHPKAFRKYLLRLAKHPWTTDEQRLDSYADYYIMLYKTKHNRYNTSLIQSMWKNYRKIMQDDHDEFVKLYTKYKEKIDKQEKQYALDRKTTRLIIFQELATKHNVPQDNINKIMELVNNNTMSDEYLESIIMEFSNISINNSMAKSDETIQKTHNNIGTSNISARNISEDLLNNNDDNDDNDKEHIEENMIETKSTTKK